MILFFALALVLSLSVIAVIAAPSRRALLRSDADTPGADNRLLRFTAIAALCAAPLAAGGIYSVVGSPHSLAPDFAPPSPEVVQAEAIAAMAPEERAAMIESMVEGLRERLETTPDDVEGWRMLARSYGVIGRTEESVDAFREVITRETEANQADWRGFASALLEARTKTTGEVDDETVEALTRLREFNPDDPLALFYLGLAARGRGDTETAVQNWRRLKEIAPDDGPVTPVLDKLIAETESPAGAEDANEPG